MSRIYEALIEAEKEGIPCALADRVIRIESYADLSPVPIAPEGYFVLCTSSHKGDGEALASLFPD